MFGRRPKARILLEASTESEWDLLARASGGEYFFSLTRYLFVATRPGD
jgi:hypothetical protein